MNSRAACALASVALLAAFWLYAWDSVQALLARDAQARVAAWQHGPSPWQWRLAQPEAVVWPGSTGLQRDATDTAALAGTVADGNADLSLDLRGERIDLSVLEGAMLSGESQAPARVVLLADGEAFAQGALPAPAHLAHLAATPRASAHAEALRLHVETAPGTRVRFDSLWLVPRAGLSVAACDALAPCRADVPRVVAPAFLLPESLLAWRDAALRQRPTAVVEPRSGAQGTGALATAHAGKAAWLLALTPVFIGLLSRLRGEETSRAKHALALVLVFAPWLLMLRAGWPGPETPERATWVFAGVLAGALCLHPLDPWRWLGDRAAWRAAASLALAALAVVALATLANAFDGDGFVARPVSALKAWQYPAWALLQQAILLLAIAPRTRRLVGSARGDEPAPLLAAVLAGGLFGLLHAPNFVLMVVTFAAGTAFAWLGYRHRALLPLAAVHAAAGIALVWAAPPWLLRSAEIGGRYLMAP